MNEVLQKHGCSVVFTVPEGLRELMSDITREVLRWQPANILDFIANYLSALLITREHGVMAVKILEDLCDCRPSVSEHLLQIGFDRPQADDLAAIIKDEIEVEQPTEGKEKVKETNILKKILRRYPLGEEMSVKVIQVVRNAYRDYWYRKNMMTKALKMEPEEAWEKAAQHTLEIYKKTKPSISELRRAAEKIQAAYRGYHVRRNVLRHLMPPEKKKKHSRKVELPGPPLDIATSREICLGPVIQIKVKKDDVEAMFNEEAGDDLGLKYDPTKTLTDKTVPAEESLTHATKVSVLELTLKKPSLSGTEDTSVTHSDHEKPTRRTSPIPEHYAPHHRISFADEPPVIIKPLDDDLEDELEVPEEPGLNADPTSTTEPPGTFEVPEELAGKSDIGNQIKESCKLALPDGLKELMSDITREVLRYQPRDLYQFIADYLAAMLVTRENLAIANYICKDMVNCRCEPELHTELRDIGLAEHDVKIARDIIVEYLETGKVDEDNLIMKLVKETNIGEDMLPAIQDAIRTAYLRHLAHNTTKYESSSESENNETMCAAKHTIELYRKTAPNNETYEIMSEKIQNTYRAYGVKRDPALKSKHKPSVEKSVTLLDPKLGAQMTPSSDIVFSKNTYTKDAMSSKSSAEDLQIQISSSMNKRRILTMSSTSLAGSFLNLPKYKPYNAHNCDILSELGEYPEKEHAHIDYTAVNPHISLVTEDKLFYKRDQKKISFNEAAIRSGLHVDDDSSMDSRNEFIGADSDLFYRADVMRVESSYDGDTELDHSDMSVRGKRGKARNSF